MNRITLMICLLLVATLTGLLIFIIGVRRDCVRLVGPCALKDGQTSHGSVYTYESCPMTCKDKTR